MSTRSTAVKGSVKTLKKKKTKTVSAPLQNESENPDAYDHLVQKVNENRHKWGAELIAEQPVKTKKGKVGRVNNEAIKANFQEDDNIMQLEVGANEDAEFPSNSDGEEFETEEDEEDDEIQLSSQNINAVVDRMAAQVDASSVPRSPSAVKDPQQQLSCILGEGPGTSTRITNENRSQDLQRKVAVMQHFMVKKGLISVEELE